MAAQNQAKFSSYCSFAESNLADNPKLTIYKLLLNTSQLETFLAVCSNRDAAFSYLAFES